MSKNKANSEPKLRVVVPGEKLCDADGTFQGGRGTYVQQGSIYASTVGNVTTKEHSDGKVGVRTTTMLICLLMSVGCCNSQESGAIRGRELVAEFNMAGVVGNVSLHQESALHNVTITLDLQTLHEANATWEVRRFPVDYSVRPLCGDGQIGPRVVDLTTLFGPLPLPARALMEVSPESMSLWGSKTIWGQSLVIHGPEGTACATFLTPDASEKILDVHFTSSLAGVIRFVQSGAFDETLILTHLLWLEGSHSSHEWHILATDVLDSRSPDSKCSGALDLFDPGHVNDASCSSSDHKSCKAGDLGRKHGAVQVGPRNNPSQERYVDLHLSLPSNDGIRTLVVALMDATFPDATAACGVVHYVLSRELVAVLDSGGVRGQVRIHQPSPFSASLLRVELDGIEADSLISVHQFPVGERIKASDDPCAATGGLFDPWPIGEMPLNASASFDRLPAGAISIKHGQIEGSARDPYLHAMGVFSVLGRSVVVVDANGMQVACGTLNSITPMITAQVVFVHPVAGTVQLQQVADDTNAETVVTIDGLLYTDGRGNGTEGHKWQVLVNAVGRDFLNWTQRCNSAGGVFDPFNVGQSQSWCGHDQLLCPVGELWRRAATLKVAAHRKDVGATRAVFTLLNVPLDGAASVIGRTLAVRDEHAPDFRGDRMACAIIRLLHSVDAHVTSWRSADRPVPVSGRVDFHQSLKNDVTQVFLELSGLASSASTLTVHQSPVPLELDFPCSKDEVQGPFNPFNVSNAPPAGYASSDYYASGDLSGKSVDLRKMDSVMQDFVDTDLPIQGAHSIIGRSVVISKSDRNAMWVCGTVEAQEPEGGSVVSAIASFHDPRGFAYGYVRLTQLQYKDGSASDTWIDMKLRYAGPNNRNLTLDHAWSVYVNPVGYDATVKPHRDRCVAAGFKWNPFLVVDSTEDYKQDCSPYTPFRCAMGDCSLRLDTVDIGGAGKIFSDPNLPLTGENSIIGRSVVVFDKKRSEQRFACANIQKDRKVTTVVTIKNPPRFSSTIFMEQAREVLGVPPWLMFADSSQTQPVLDDVCVQVTVHFRGKDVDQLQRIFTDLVASGWVTRYSPAADPNAKPRRFGYKLCRAELNGASGLRSYCWFLVVLFFTATIVLPLGMK